MRQRGASAASLRAVPATRSPRASNSSVSLRPMPLLTPVMNQVR